MQKEHSCPTRIMQDRSMRHFHADAQKLARYERQPKPNPGARARVVENGSTRTKAAKESDFRFARISFRIQGRANSARAAARY